MRSAVVAVGSLLVAGLVGCGPGVNHTPARHLVAGQALPISVRVDLKKGESASGEVHYRFNRSSYRATSLSFRGRELWAVLPTESLPPGERVAYYIDVEKGGEHVGLASPTRPYTVPVVSRLDAKLSTVRVTTTHRHAYEPVGFYLRSDPGVVESAILTYTVPGVPGEVTASMRRMSSGRFALEIPPPSVPPGRWSWRVTALVEGKPFHYPEHGRGVFDVTVPPHDHRDHDHKDHKKKRD